MALQNDRPTVNRSRWTISGNDLRGLHADRPAADDASLVPGVTYWSVDEPAAPGTVYVTDGTTWTVMTVV